MSALGNAWVLAAGGYLLAQTIGIIDLALLERKLRKAMK